MQDVQDVTVAVAHLVLGLMLFIFGVQPEDVQASLPVQGSIQCIVVTPECSSHFVR